MLIIFQTTGPNVEPSYAFPCKCKYISLNYLYLKKKIKSQIRTIPIMIIRKYSKMEHKLTVYF